jgi:hypothetical protein
MTAKKTELPDNPRKRKRVVPTRAAGTPAFDVVEDLFSQGFAKRELNSEPYPTLPYPTLAKTTVPDHSITKEKANTDVSPNKNFVKLPNSIVKKAIPEGLFRGQSKHTYDVLYLQTRGAINPVRQIQLTKLELVKLTGLEIKTIQRHLSFLRSVNLITVDPKIGDHKGAIYEVNIPEEITLPYPTLVQTTLPQSTLAETGVVSTPHPSIESTRVGYGLMPENIGQNESLNTLLKTNTNDDDALAEFRDVMSEISRKWTNKGLSNNQKGKWKELAELLSMELDLAAARTKSISDVPAFLTEHLRRRLMPVKRETTKAKPNKPNQGGRQSDEQLEIENYKAEPLTEEGREATLKSFSGYIEKGQKEFILSLKNTYTERDWEWLMNELKID